MLLPATVCSFQTHVNADRIMSSNLESGDEKAGTRKLSVGGVRAWPFEVAKGTARVSNK